ncbi:MAG: cytochrome bd ubiquinol oxidase subunit, partial [Streptomyces sp.]|nr:cytochrome bd ubiquinol oxidase subunit [Streptomyces sp.]
MELHDVWFVLIAVLWIGYFFLEGFDFGVGVLTKLLARNRIEKRVLINTIGPVWDGNEVWLLTAGGATFAAFPEWYATLFSGFYLPLLIILVCLIVRGVAFEYRAKRDEESWQRNWENAIFWASLIPAILWGVAFGNIVRGVKIDENFNYVGNFWDLLNPYAILGGLVTLTLFTFHGAVFVGLKTVGDIRVRARKLALQVGLTAAVLALLFLLWTQVENGDGESLVAMVVAVVALVAALVAVNAGREG